MNIDKVDLVVKNVKVYNSYYKKFYYSDVYILEGKFLHIGKNYDSILKPKESLDGKNMYMIPGFIDIHMHIESSMVSPERFGDFISRCGVTTIVSEPHEMANVAGIEGIFEMMKAGENSLIDIFYGIPSSVPASSEKLETTGGKIDYNDMAVLKENPLVACVGEVMNYRQIIEPNNLEISRFLDKLRKEDPIFPIEGHCPSLIDLDLSKFLYLGINADHTEHNMEEIEQRFKNGMFVEIQEKMLNKELISYIQKNNLYEHFSFVTDDVMADTLHKEGHLDHLVRKAINYGLSAEQAIYNATYTPSRRMNLLDRGVIAPGKSADFVLLKDLDNIDIYSTYKKGKSIYNKESIKNEIEIDNLRSFSEKYYNSIKLSKVKEENFKIIVEEDVDNILVRVMEINDGSTKTIEKIVRMPVENHLLKWEESDCLLTAVFERYGKNGNIGLGFLTGDCHKIGTVGTSYSHDNHNILVAGSNIEDMTLVVNKIIDLQGGMVVAKDGEILSSIELNVGGILSEKPISYVADRLENIRNDMINLGYRHYNPIMSFGTLSLTVSPSLKLTDKGLVDVKNSRLTSLFVEEE